MRCCFLMHESGKGKGSDGVMVSISERQARGPCFDPWWKEFSFKFHQSFLISKEKHIAHLKAFKKFASPYFQSPKSFPVPKILWELTRTYWDQVLKSQTTDLLADAYSQHYCWCLLVLVDEMLFSQA